MFSLSIFILNKLISAECTICYKKFKANLISDETNVLQRKILYIFEHFDTKRWERNGFLCTFNVPFSLTIFKIFFIYA